MIVVLLIASAWTLALQVGPTAGRAFADPVSSAGPIIDPETGAAWSATSSGDLVPATVASVAGEDVGAEVGGGICVAAGGETLGAACIAGVAIGVTCLAWTSGCSAALGSVKAAGRYALHFLGWPQGHSSGAPAPPAGSTSGVSYRSGYYFAYTDARCAGTDSNAGCLTVGFPAEDSGLVVSFHYTVSGGGCQDYSCANGASMALNLGDPTTRNIFGASPGIAGLCFTDPHGTGEFIGLWGSMTGCAGAAVGGGGTHQWTTTADCVDGTSAVAQSDPFSDSDPTPAPAPVPLCASGSPPASISFTDSPSAGTTALTAPTWHAPPEWSQPVDDQDYGECDPGGSDVPCVLVWQAATDDDLALSSDPAASRWTGCADIAGLCQPLADFIAATPVDQYAATYAVKVLSVPDPNHDTPYRFRCLWGPYHVDATDCVKGGSATGTDVDSPAANQPLDDTDDCFPHGWSVLITPLWFYDPLKCVFVPKLSDLEASATKVQTAVSGSALGTVSSGVADLAGAVAGLFGGAGDCHGPALPAIPQVGLMDSSHPFDACSPPLQTWAAFSRGLLTFLVYVGGGYVALEWVASAFGWHLPWKRIAPWWEGAEQQALF